MRRFPVKIMKGTKKTREYVGIHITNPTIQDIDKALEKAYREGWSRVYVYRKLRKVI